MRAATLVVATPRGRQVFLRALVPQGRAEMERGLAGLPPLRETEAMIFVFPALGPVSFHTVGMRGPLDFLFADDAGLVHSVVRRVPPGRGRVEVVPPSRAVVELAGGTADLLGVGPGSRLKLLDAALAGR